MRVDWVGGGQTLASATPQSTVISQELDKLMNSVVEKSGEVKAGLKMIEESTKKLEADDPSGKPAEVRIRQNQHHQLTTQFITSMKAYQDASEQYSQKYRDQVPVSNEQGSP